MANQIYIINTDSIIRHNGANYTRHDEIELTPEQYERVKADVIPKGIVEANNGEKDINDLSVDELKALAEAKGLEVVGTGKDGNILKADYLKALQ